MKAIPFAILAVSSSLVVAPLCAQQARVVPSGLADIEGNLISTYPIGRTNGGLQIIADPNQVASAPGFVLEAAFRVDGADPNLSYVGYTKQYKLTVAQTTVTAAAMTTNPVTNHAGATPTIVFQQPMNIPSSSAQPTAPRPFSVRFPFNQTFPYDPNLGGLILTLTTDDTTSVSPSWRLDGASLRNDRPDGLVGALAPGCTGIGGAAMTLAVDATQLNFGGNLAATITSNTAGAFPLSAFLLGFQRQALDLTPLGMSGCTLGTTIDAALTVPEVGGVYAPVVLSIPNNPALEGAPMFSQVLGVGTTPGSLTGSVVSNLLGLRIGNPAGHSTWAQSMFTSDPNSTSWSLGRVGTFMPVLELTGILP